MKLEKLLEERKFRFESIKSKVLSHLESLEKEEKKTLNKAFTFALLGKGGRGLPVGTIREWKGKKFIKIAPGKWRPKYDSHTKGAKLAISALKKKIVACKDEHEMMQIILENRDRFSDINGNPLPFVQELHEFINGKTKKEKTPKKEVVNSDNDKNMKEDNYPEKEYPEYKGKGQEAVDFIVNNKGGQVRGAFYKEGIGDIDVVWGEVTDKEKHTGYGLAHIIDKHGMDAINKIGEVVKDGEIVKDDKNRLSIQKNKYNLGLAETWYGKNKIWIITNYEKKEDSTKSVYPSTDNTEGIQSETSNTSIPQSSEKSTSIKEKQELEQKKQEKALEYGFDLSNYYPYFSNEFQEAYLDNDLYLCDRISEVVKEYNLRKEEIRAFVMDIHVNEGYRGITSDDSKWAYYNVIIPDWLREKGSYLEQVVSRVGFEKAREIFNKILTEYNNILDEKNKELKPLSNMLETGKSSTVKHKELGEIIIDAGSTGKNGYGLKHIIEQRYKKDGDEDEITALLYLIQDTLKDGKVKKNDSNYAEVTKDGVMAVISKQRHGNKESWLLTGYELYDEKGKATDAIKAVIAQYEYASEYSVLNNQVGAVIASMDRNISNSDEKSNMKKSIVKPYKPSQSWKKAMAELKAVYNL